MPELSRHTHNAIMVSIVEMHIFMHSCTGFDVGYYLFLFFFGGGRELCYLAPKITSFRVKSTLAIYGLVRMTEFFFFFLRCQVSCSALLGCHAFFPEVLCSYCFTCLMQYMFQPAQFSILINCEGLQLMPKLLS